MPPNNQSLRDRATLTDERRSEIEIDYHENSGHNVTHLIRDVVYEERDHALRVVLEAVEEMAKALEQSNTVLKNVTELYGPTVLLRSDAMWKANDAALANFRRWQAEVRDG